MEDFKKKLDQLPQPEKLYGLDLLKARRDYHVDVGNVHGEFDDLAQFKQHALSDKWDIGQNRIHIAGIPYLISKAKDSDSSWYKALSREQPPMVIYSMAGADWKPEAKKLGLNSWVLIVWRKFDGNVFRPTIVLTTKSHTLMNSSLSESSAPVDKDNMNHIGPSVLMKITSLPQSPELKAKVDTGATMSSLHAERYTVKDGSVSFVCSHLSKNVMTLPLVTHQATKTADGGVENRPVIELNIRLNGKIIQSVHFNLNNRHGMEYPVLIGQNVLQKGKFLIDPSMVGEGVDDEFSVDWESLMEEIEPIMLAEDAKSDDSEFNQTAKDIVQLILESDMSLADIILHAREIDENNK